MIRHHGIVTTFFKHYRRICTVIHWPL